MAVAERTLQNVLKEYRSDKTLVRAAQSGRSDAYAALVSRYYPKVYSFVSHLLSSYRHRASAPSAEDLTQEVFTRALNALSKFNGDYRFGPWLLRIARNLCVDETRRDSHRAEPADPVELPNMEPTAG
ncbi:MAG: RNA polymerase sigma factor, partial [Acidimicrobiia bacterium]